MGGETRPSVHTKPSSYPILSKGPVGQQIEHIYRDRLGQFRDRGQYKEQSLASKLHDATNNDRDHVKLSVYSPPDLIRPTFKDATSHDFKPTSVGATFGPAWSTHWIKVRLTVPSCMMRAEHLEFHWDANNEGMVWSEDGEPLQGLTGGGDRIEWVIPERWRDGNAHVFYIEMACNGMFGNAPGGGTIQPPDPGRSYTLRKAEIVAVSIQARQLWVDFWIIGDAAKEFPGDSWERHSAQQVCNRIMDCFIAGDGTNDCIRECRKIAQEYIGGNVDSAKVYNSGEKSLVYGIGHCHIDTCWLWPWAETKRKVARSWSSQCDLMDRYPEYRFTVSQAQQYKWLKEDYPTVFDRVKRKVKEGRFQPVGGTWVEHDTNMPSGEALSRQFLYGQRFFESHFGERCQTHWNPDVFGFSPQIPQLCRLAKMNRFFTQKLSWNNINKFPHTTFNWVALDGSQVICHMAPSETYTANADFGDVVRSVTQHRSMDQDNTSLLVFGKGDGGGGPTREMLEKLRRCRGLSDNIGRLPRVELGRSVDDFFDHLEQKAADGTDFVTWYGELYLEFHRGTYTTQANNKLNNRKQEIMMHDIEYLATLASVKSNEYSYPKKEIDDIWENILLCQFHDCLPGTSIGLCYDDSDKLYAANAKLGRKLRNDALEVLGLSSKLNFSAELAAMNTLPWNRTELIRTPGTAANAKQSSYVIASGSPGMIEVSPASTLASTVSIKETRKGVFQMTNTHFEVEIEKGCITSFLDLKAEREVIAKGGKGNQLVIFDDKPTSWPAWNVDVFHLASRKTLKSEDSEILESGPYRVSVVTKTQISKDSWVKTTVSLDASHEDVPGYVAVDSEVEWRETMKFLKVEFPVDIMSTEASYETQYGIIRRPTHYNTSWDMAKYEVCCHKFADLSEANYGVSILNDSKYGFATAGNLMRLSLLRAPKAPDAQADMGRHHIRWAIMPHAGPLGSDTVRTAINFNNPMKLVSVASSATVDKDLFTAIRLTGASSLVLDVVKRGEDDEDVSRGELPKRKGRSVIIRVYESIGGKSRGTIQTRLPVSSIHKCNILEDDQEELKSYSATGGTSNCDIELRAFEVATFRLQL